MKFLNYVKNHEDKVIRISVKDVVQSLLYIGVPIGLAIYGIMTARTNQLSAATIQPIENIQTDYAEVILSSPRYDTTNIMEYLGFHQETLSEKKEKIVNNNLTELLLKFKQHKQKLTEWDLFRLKTYQIAKELKNEHPSIGGTSEQIYDWSMKTFRKESGFVCDVKCKVSSAKGLFQATNITRKELGMPDPKYLTAIEQLEWYKKYINMQIKNQHIKVEKITSVLDWYLIVFYPAISHADDDKVFAKCYKPLSKCIDKNGNIHCNYHANRWYDIDGNKIIYKSEIGVSLLKKYIND